VSVSAVTLLGTCTPLPSLIDQIKTLGELRWSRAMAPRYYRGADDMPEGPEYELAAPVCGRTRCKTCITPVRSYAEIYAALTSGHAHLAARGSKSRRKASPAVEFGPAYQHVATLASTGAERFRPASLAEIGTRRGNREGSSHAKLYTPPAMRCPTGLGGERQHRHQALLDGVAAAASTTTIADSTNSHWHTMRIRICASLSISPACGHSAWAASTATPEFLQT